MIKLPLFLFTLLLSFTSLSQSKTISYLTTYGQVWGFLKYFHPEPSKMDWDNVLIQDFENLTSCNSNKEFDQIIDKLISTCGEYKPKKRNLGENEYFVECIEWFENENLSTSHRNTLQCLFRNKPKFKNKYISVKYAGNPKPQNEKEYSNALEQEAIRYLALTRYWNIINYYFPNRPIIPQNWNSVYSDHLTNFRNASTVEAYELSLHYLSSTIQDGHAFIRIENGLITDYNYLPFFCSNLKEGTFLNYVKSDSLNHYSIQRLDKIVSIDGMSIDKYWEEVRKRVSASNEYYAQKSTHYFRQTMKDSVSITIERDGKRIHEILYPTKQIGLYPKGTVFKKERSSGLYEDSISGKLYGYINMGTLNGKDITRGFRDSLEQVDHLIIDSRNYPNWTLFALGNVLIKKKSVFARFRKMNLDFPGSYYYVDAKKVGGAKNGYNGKIYILVDYMTMSQAEYTVMALQNHPNAITIGGQTAGADGNISSIPMPNGYNLFFSGLGVYYPDGTDTQQAGIRRDIETLRSIEDLKLKRDHTLQKAMDLIRD